MGERAPWWKSFVETEMPWSSCKVGVFKAKGGGSCGRSRASKGESRRRRGKVGDGWMLKEESF